MSRNVKPCVYCGVIATQEVGYSDDGAIYYECDYCRARYKQSGDKVEVPSAEEWTQHYYTFDKRPQ